MVYFITIDWLLVSYHLLNFWQTIKMTENENRIKKLKQKTDTNSPDYILEAFITEKFERI